MLEAAEKAADQLGADGVEVTVWDVRCWRRSTPTMLADAASHPHVITIEDGVRDGGIGMTIADRVCAIDHSTRVDVLGLPTKFMPHDPKSGNILGRYGLDAAGLIATVRDR